jgi:hypothetical protein
VLNLTEDSGTWKAVKPFLHEYENLLLSAGSHRLNLLNRTNRQPSAGISGVAVDLAKQFSEMRREGRLTDLFFEPVIQTADDESSDSRELGAHKVILAATLPYFRDKFELENETTPPDEVFRSTKFKFEGTRFAAKLVLGIVRH